MGSFNTTCFASGQTIAPRDKCLVIPLQQAATYHAVQLTRQGKSMEAYGAFTSTCYPDAFWSPLCGGFDATYDDCGRFRLDRSDHNLHNLSHWVKILRKESPVTLQGEIGYHDHPFDLEAYLASEAPHFLAWLDAPKDAPVPLNREVFLDEAVKCWDYAFLASEQSRLFRMYSGEPRPLQFAVMHHLAVEELVALVSKGTDYDDLSLAPRSVFERVLKAGRDAADAEDEEASPEEHAKRKAWIFRAEGARKLQEFGRSTLGPRAEQQHLHQVIDQVGAGAWSVEDAFEKFWPSLRGRYICLALEQLNLHFSPLVYAGQDYDNSIGRDYARFIRKVSTGVSRERRGE